jgi:hypothetical protein
MIYLITTQQKDVLESLTNFDIVFRPILDANDVYFISENEYFYIVGLWYLDECPSELVFIKDLIASEYLPKIQENVL